METQFEDRESLSVFSSPWDLIAEINRLRAELAEMGLEQDRLKQYEIACVALTEEADSLRAELAECKRDAERYRYLRKNPAMLLHLSNREFDHAIDAARKGEGE